MVGGEVVDVRGPRQRRLLAVLALRPATLVDTGEILEAVWPDGVLPANPKEALRTYISRLRVALGGAQMLVGRDGGYRLDLPVEAVDASCFEALLARSANQRDLGESQGCVAALDEALALWRGQALAGFEHEEWARPAAVRLNELRYLAIEDRAELRIEMGQHRAAVPELEAAVASQPLREHSHRLLMTALQRSGRQGEALRVFEDFRRRLATDLGLEPDEGIRSLQSQIARGEPAGPPTPPKERGLRGYRIIERIGVGAFAVVYRAHQPAVGRDVAIKVIRAELANQAEFVRRFEAEAHLVARLEHPHIVPLYDYWREPGAAFLVMRLLAGTLHDYIHQQPLLVTEATKMLTQVGSALAVAHRAGVVHRDVKPANIFCDEDGNYFLGDFGIASQPDTSVPSRGSLGYAPPEQRRRQRPDPATDVYGLGVTLLESLTGPGSRLGHASCLDEAEAQLPSALSAVIRRATAEDLAVRFSSVELMVDAFMEALNGRGPAPSLGRGRAPLVERTNPYKGLRAFQEADSLDFFGRQRLVQHLIERLQQPGSTGRLLAVVGPSGSGKSSVVRAGLLPAVRAGAIPGSPQWFVTSMVPGVEPFKELALALRRVATVAPGEGNEWVANDRRRITGMVNRVLANDGDDLLLIIDQFEELFTLCPNEATRRQFIEGLVAAVTDPGSRLRVVLTLRADFYDHPLRYGAMAGLLEAATAVVAPLAADELERAIVEPAARVGVGFEPGLVASIIGDVVDQPGALPLLQYALTELFDRRQPSELPDPVMTTDAYRKLGGLTGALTLRAEQLYLEATDAEQFAIRRLVTRLVNPGEGTQDTRRRVWRGELGADSVMVAVIDRFGAARLVSFDHDPTSREPTVEVAHEALIREWPRLGAWLDHDRDGLRTHRHLTATAGSWLAGDRDAGELYRGARLETAEVWASAHGADLNDDERMFLHASAAAHRAELHAADARAAERERQHRRLRRLLAVVAVVALVAVLTSTLAVQQRGRANDKAAAANQAAFDAETGRMVAEAEQLVATNPRVALLLAAETHRREPGPRTLGALQRVLTGTGELLGYLGGGTRYGALRWLDEDRIAAARAGAIDVFGEDGRIANSIPIAGATVLVPTPDGSALGVIAEGTASVVQLASGSLSGPFSPSSPTGGSAQALAWSADGGELAVGSSGGEVVVYDTATWKETWRQIAHPERTLAELNLPNTIAETAPHLPLASVRGVTAVAFVAGAGPDGASMVATAGFGYLRIWDRGGTALRVQVPLTRPSGAGELVTVAVAMDVAPVAAAQRVIVADRHRAWVVDPARPDTAERIELPTPVASAAGVDLERQVSVAGARIVSDYQLGTAYVTDLERPGPPRPLQSHLADNHHLALHPGGDRVALSSSDGLAVVSLVGDGLIARSFDIGPGDLQVTNDGSFISRFDYNQQVAEIWRVSNRGADLVPITGIEPAMTFLTGEDALVFDFQAGVGIVDLPGGGLRAMLQGWAPLNGIVVAAASADRNLLAIGATDGLVHVFSMRDGSVRYRLSELQSTRTAWVRMVNFDQAGLRLVGTNVNGAAVVWDLAAGTHTALAQPAAGSGRGQVTTDFAQAAFTPDGTQLLTQSADGTMTMRDATTWQPTGKRFIGNTSGGSFDNGPFFSADGRYLVSAADRQPRLWDVQSAQQIGGTFPFDADYVSNASPNARWLVTGRDGQVLRWNLNVDAWPAVVCQAAGRNLTAAEWDRYGPTGPARSTCPDHPPPALTN